MQGFITGEDVFREAPAHMRQLLDAPPGLSNGFYPLGEGPGAAGSVVLRLDPHHVLERHAHDCHRFETVVAGTLYVEDRVLHPGDVMVAEPGQFYGPHTAGPDGVTTCEVFSTLQAAYQPLFEAPDGTVHRYDFLTGDIPSAEVVAHNRQGAPEPT